VNKTLLTKAEAERIAHTRVKDGIIKSAELEREHGKRIWSFDIARPGQTNLIELQIDALTGDIISTEVETPKHEAAESKAEHHEHR
jgi:uncharacterized membrane protein YkoI